MSRNASSTFAFDKPIHTSVVLLFTAAITIITFSRFLARYAGSSDGHEYTSVPLAEVGHPHASREPSPVPSEARGTLSPLQLRLCFFVLICAICVRVAIARQILANIQCTILTWEPLVPLVFAMWDYWTVYRHKRALYEGDSTGSVDDALEAYVSRSPYRFMCAAALVNIGSLIALSRSSGLESSYICASSLNNHWLVPLIQHLGTLTDILILYCVSRLLETQGGRSARSVSMRFRSVGFAILVRRPYLLPDVADFCSFHAPCCSFTACCIPLLWPRSLSGSGFLRYPLFTFGA